jgi:predicted DNA-binding transcriptional regulator YafY
MRIDRLFEIVYILLRGKNITARDLAGRFEVSVRTIYRDIDALISAKIPIYTTQGKGGGIALMDGYVLDRALVSENEQTEIISALQSLAVTRFLDADAILLKLGGIFKKNDAPWMEIDFSPWGGDKSHRENFNALKGAIINGKTVSIDYRNARGERSRRSVEPAKLLFKCRAWYVRGFCLSKQANRIFKLSRISEVQMTGESFSQRPAAEGEEGGSGEAQPERVTLVLRISPNGAYRVLDEFDENDVAANEDGSYTVTASLPGGVRPRPKNVAVIRQQCALRKLKTNSRTLVHHNLVVLLHDKLAPGNRSPGARPYGIIL